MFCPILPEKKDQLRAFMSTLHGIYVNQTERFGLGGLLRLIYDGYKSSSVEGYTHRNEVGSILILID